ncbi:MULTISPECIES: hypothetical protein [unclassified Mesorhizobium]|uniref:hypothetical protein n=1 Tax=unclassified Mesorhizobium TaxID=325217 RepID=UPI000FCCB8EC|nr:MULTISPECIES: hypothetical protein [unclassified Mesorhizobium]RUT86783.1 hypothetical protein EOD15_24585 [Mesorhizobium sp. M7A.T.Ca.US.000.02.2.1]RUT87628.1 hypothetical protein EOD14_09525 [Mesorhizobium sp. M7A.T.Ca.US.000.02.1.1]
MSQEQQVPPIPADVIDWLDRLYPEKCADPKDADREIWMKSGERRLVRRLRLELQRQENTVYVRST